MTRLQAWWVALLVPAVLSQEVMAQQLPLPQQLDAQLIAAARDPQETQTHQQLVRSLRNQELMTEQAAAQVVQLTHQLQAAKTLAELRKLGQQPRVDANTAGSNIELDQFRLRAIVENSHQWLAEFEYLNNLIAVSAGQRLLGIIEVERTSAGLQLSYGEQLRVLSIF
ncbi:hypothetical protein SAMN06297229_0835 [Pseudidiomarina planktonica]|uniref:Type IV pilus biogenesis protein PilP n=1 Tax=Pseudidiomarina planktonica TaxID=1323738 RepID=A0A1Y6EL15_9GAMM|nr:hypothetical protein [Pseudidiomarina planktonica]RUO65718.1 hypothetical protein CWI77_04585 [Pseudidiomarina planktonica]SMQ63305.1 hypothetical protein SAMN06297229_0835 [Pseudidiomarina planktonica]